MSSYLNLRDNIVEGLRLMPNPRCYVDGKAIRGKYVLQEVGSSGVLKPVCSRHRDSSIPVPVSEPILSEKGLRTLIQLEADRQQRKLRGPFNRPLWAYERD